jgi:large conductance mechanosensitive channel
MFQEFRKFILHGSMVDMAVGIVVGAAFGEAVSSFVRDIVMPPIGLLLGGMDFSELAITLQAASGETQAVVIAYGKFIQTALDFAIVAFAVFMAIKGMNKLRASSPPEPTPPDTALLTEIRDLLQQQPKSTN